MAGKTMPIGKLGPRHGRFVSAVTKESANVQDLRTEQRLRTFVILCGWHSFIHLVLPADECHPLIGGGSLETKLDRG